MKVAFHTLGCKVNQYETEALRLRFRERGYEIVGETDPADIYVINTCTVTSLADRKSRQYIRKMKKQSPDSVVAVTGCYAQISPEEVKAVEGVNIVTGTNEKGKLIEYIEEFLLEHKPQLHVKSYEELRQYEETGLVTATESRTRAYIKIQEGCNRFCSYCVIPYARGSVRSREPEDVLTEAEGLIGQGFKELVLTGINTALYGTEEGFSVRDDFWGIETIIRRLDRMPGDFRIRLSSLEPAVVNADYVKRLLRYEKLCPHLHLSAQSGSDRILTAMNRPYTRQEYLDIVKVLKDFDPGYGITTDLIAGFPGETEEDFRDSVRLIEEAEFCKVHAFKYSQRPFTKAASMPDQIPAPMKKARTQQLIEAGEQASLRFFQSNRGSVRRVLVEEYEEKSGCLTGYTDNYIRVYIESGDETAINQFRRVKLLEPFEEGMKGEFQ
ncbi:tRNA (N(6)-L-threonylcarbamoyladenosine(37)-C(2))-methylthiotransferase MtaB [Anaerovorax odorimutans]|uniref:tRNA (N(6)-L-threonylcarbamoyladenosine(37)-C(2))-methylthiotransferase n=1 Tax=Anaerovorax odorimutans TaxID=109327 RepID=A0ABT1RLI7_9FIRM|nr:tRNA (N(6)-L-threonylcarbamoyladenosine(37)-C(2))-methylthiotransferase MtaB [Anaerovorax odorimutans]MCQ4636044.1 tRNA (N(6)-L-threonylcarbamoyladenosine(37)-C(2))-methylthiotransferase MtaB [Anaerovorax odorimutans]